MGISRENCYLYSSSIKIIIIFMLMRISQFILSILLLLFIGSNVGKANANEIDKGTMFECPEFAIVYIIDEAQNFDLDIEPELYTGIDPLEYRRIQTPLGSHRKYQVSYGASIWKFKQSRIQMHLTSHGFITDQLGFKI